MGTKLVDADEGVHEVGTASNWNESRYVDFWDAGQRLGGWFRIGNRVNEGHAEMSACLYLPDGRVAFFYERPSITTNTLRAGSQSWEILEPWRSNRVRYSGDLLLLDDPWSLTDPKTAFRTAPRAHGEVDLICRSSGLSSVMGSDQDHIERIFLPGQADLHYQHLTRSTGSVRVGDHSWTFRDAGGGKDHSWGVRNWHAKIYLRWLIASLDDDHGFLLVRAVGPTKQTRSGFVLDGGQFHLVDDFEMQNEYAGAPHYELRRVQLQIRSGPRRWTAIGEPQAWLPLRHRQKNARGEDALLRIVKSPTNWKFLERPAAGMCEYHDLVVDGRPVGLHD